MVRVQKGGEIVIIDTKALKIEYIPEDDGRSVDFYSSDDRLAFTIKVINGHSIEISGGTCIKDGDKIYSEGLVVKPFVNNRIIVEKSLYEE
jgi:hypothetical protein